MSTSTDLQAILAALKSRAGASPSASSSFVNSSSPRESKGPTQSDLPLDARTAFPAYASPPPASSPPFNSLSTLPRSKMTSNTSGENHDRAQSQNLLNLLKFNLPENGAGRTEQPGHPGRSVSENVATAAQESGNNRGFSASDLVASFISPTSSSASRDARTALLGNSISTNENEPTSLANAAPENPKDALLRLLNRSQSSSSHSKPLETTKNPTKVAAESTADDRQLDFAIARIDQPLPNPDRGDRSARADSPFRAFGSREATPFEPPQIDNVSNSKEHKPIFTYTNPFEALNASRNATPQPLASNPSAASPAVGSVHGNGDQTFIGDKRKSDELSPEPTSTRRKLIPKGQLQRSSLSASQELKKDEPSESLEPSIEPSDKVSDMALDSTEVSPEVAEFNANVEALAGQLQDSALDAATVTKQEVDSEENRGTIDDHAPPPAAETVRKITNDAADAWESADDLPAKEAPPRIVPVYNFPIKPFVSITLKPSPESRVGLRDDGVMEISRLKKEFDQLDRTLAAATNKYITYALVKNGGMRIIRQEDGSDRQIFKNSHDRIFNVALCTTAVNAAPTEEQAVLGIGVSGSVYYATVWKEANDLFEDDALESESLIFPPFPLGDENTSGGMLKTRAKKSSRHPEFFAIGRGKAIHLIWPATAMSSKYGVGGTARTVDVEKLYKDRSLKITTGKAGKDFAFSEDDSLIVSLDKTGRLRFWDIRLLVEESNATASKVHPIEIRIPLLSLATASPAEKSWPTSVLFIDKLRPYTKGSALRYVLVGLKQNHTLQLWDIGLGKAVQEINFPHENETDGICSVNYHPNSGIIVVGHPTRNSIYFIHLSAPKYGLAPMTQAMYIERLAIKDTQLPKPESTACMSGIREISFSGKGQLRSVDLLPIYPGTEAQRDGADSAPLFELYVVHSKGVTCLNVRKEDLGWSSESKVLNPVDAVDEDLITLRDLRLGTVIDESAEVNVQPEELQQTKESKKKSSKNATKLSEEPQQPAEPSDPFTTSDPAQAKGLTNGFKATEVATEETAEKEPKKKKKKSAGSANTSQAPKEIITSKPPPTTISPSKQPPSNPEQENPEAPAADLMGPANSTPRTVPVSVAGGATETSESVTIGISGDWLDKELKKIENSVSNEFKKELNNLYRNIQTDRTVQDSAAVSRQEAVLRLISTTLSTNVEKSLGQMIMAQMQQVVVPSISAVTMQAVSGQVGDGLARMLHQLVPHELGAQLPAALSGAVQNPQFVRIITESVSQKVVAQVENHLSEILHNTISPSFKSLAVSVAEKAASEAESRFNSKLGQLEIERRNDSAKIEKLNLVLQNIGETLQAMSDSQVAFQSHILKDRRQLAVLSEQLAQMSIGGLGIASGSQASSSAREVREMPIVPPTPAKPRSKEELELEEISELMNEGKYEEGSIKWLQSQQPIDLFDKLFVRFTPDYLTTDVSALVAFSVGITVANSLMTNTTRRLQWIDAAFTAVDIHDPEMADLSQHAPALITSLVQKLDNLYMQTVDRNPNDPVLRLISSITHKAREMKAGLQGESRQPSRSGYYR